MMRLPISFGVAVLIGAVLMVAPASAAPLAGLAKKLSGQSSGDSMVVQVQRRGRGRRRGRGWRGDGGAAAAGAIGGLLLGAIIAGEAQRRQAVEYCMQRFRSYDPETGTWIDSRGRVRRCP